METKIYKKWKHAMLFVCLVIGSLWNVQAQNHSTDGWNFNINNDGTATLLKPTVENWSIDGLFEGYGDRIMNPLIIPSTVQEKFITLDNGHWYITYGNTYVVTAFGAAQNFGGLTNEQRLAVTGASIPNTVTSLGTSAFSGCSYLPNITIPTSVTNIGAYAFQYDSALVSITIPASVTSVGIRIFQNCASMQSAIVLNSIVGQQEFSNCPALKEVSLPDNLTTIGMDAFENCTGIETLTIPASVTTFDTRALSGLTGLKNLNFYAPNVPAQFGGLPIENLDLTGVESIALSAFQSCVKLKSVTLSESLNTIGNSAFQYDSVLVSVTVPSSVTSVGIRIFQNCASMQSAIVLNSIVGQQEFSNCPALKEVSLPDNLTTIGMDAFENCTGIETLTIPASVTIFDTRALSGLTGLKNLNFYAPNVPAQFGGLPIEKLDLTGVESIAISAFQSCVKLKSVTLSESLNTIGNSAFQYDSALVSVTVPSSVTSVGIRIFQNCASMQSAIVLNSIVGQQEFSNCPALKEVSLSDNLTTIGMDAFENCTGVETLTIPASVTTFGTRALSGLTGLKNLNFYAPNVPAQFGGLPIEKLDLTGVESIAASAFSNCTALQKVTVGWATPLSVPSNVFSGVNTLAATLYVPAGTRALYEVAPVWKDFWSIIEATPDIVPVTNIIDVPTTATVGILDISGTVVPSNATYTNIVWSIKDAGTTGASTEASVSYQYIDGVLTPVTNIIFATTTEGTLIMTATVAKGNADGTDYVQDFSITITAAPTTTSIDKVDNSGFYAYTVNNQLIVESANEEVITVYSISGVRLYSVKKNPGAINIPLASLRGSVFIVSGSIGGTVKAVQAAQ